MAEIEVVALQDWHRLKKEANRTKLVRSGEECMRFGEENEKV